MRDQLSELSYIINIAKKKVNFAETKRTQKFLIKDEIRTKQSIN